MKIALAISITLLDVTLAACGLASQQGLKEQYQASESDCQNRFPADDDPKTIVAKTQCRNQALAIGLGLPAYANVADLMQSFMAYRMSVAEQYQRGQITYAQAAAMIADKISQVNSEAQSRNAVTQAATAAEWQEFGQRLSAADAAYAAGLAQAPPVQVQPTPPVSQQTFCNQLGNTITCNGPGLQQTFCNRIGNTVTCN